MTIPFIPKFYIAKNCRICNKVFYMAKKSNTYHQKHNRLRQRNAVTCSSDCSKNNSKLVHDKFKLSKIKKTKSTGLNRGVSIKYSV